MEKATRKQVFSREAIAALQEPIMVGMLCLGIAGMGLLNFNIGSMGVMVLLVSRTLDSLNKAQRRYQRVAVQESAYWSLMRTIEATFATPWEGPDAERIDVHLLYGDGRAAKSRPLSLSVNDQPLDVLLCDIVHELLHRNTFGSACRRALSPSSLPGVCVLGCVPVGNRKRKPRSPMMWALPSSRS